MSISFDKAIGNFPTFLALRSRKAEMMATNLANADTPNYKAKDLDFSRALGMVNDNANAMKMRATNEQHMGYAAVDRMRSAEMYRIPLQPSLDGNTVDTQMEKAEFAKNSLHYQTTLQLLSGKFKGLMTAIRGE